MQWANLLFRIFVGAILGPLVPLVIGYQASYFETGSYELSFASFMVVQALVPFGAVYGAGAGLGSYFARVWFYGSSANDTAVADERPDDVTTSSEAKEGFDGKRSASTLSRKELLQHALALAAGLMGAIAGSLIALSPVIGFFSLIEETPPLSESLFGILLFYLYTLVVGSFAGTGFMGGAAIVWRWSELADFFKANRYLYGKPDPKTGKVKFNRQLRKR